MKPPSLTSVSRWDRSPCGRFPSASRPRTAPDRTG
jgi:hypothetical protein